MYFFYKPALACKDLCRRRVLLFSPRAFFPTPAGGPLGANPVRHHHRTADVGGFDRSLTRAGGEHGCHRSDLLRVQMPLILSGRHFRRDCSPSSPRFGAKSLWCLCRLCRSENLPGKVPPACRTESAPRSLPWQRSSCDLDSCLLGTVVEIAAPPLGTPAWHVTG